MVVTDDDELADRMRLLRSHGMTTLTWDRHRGHAHSYDVVAAGLQLPPRRGSSGVGARPARATARRERRPAARIVERYRALLARARRRACSPCSDEGTEAAHHLAVALLPAGVEQQTVREALQAKRIQTSFHYPPIHTFSAYRDHSGRALPRTEETAKRLVTLPLYGHMGDEAVERVATAVVEAVRSERAPTAA